MCGEKQARGDTMHPYGEGIIGSYAERSELLERMQRDSVRFLRLIFTDIMGQNKNVEVPQSQFAKALQGEIMFDGSSIEGFSRIEESDMLLVPDLGSYAVFPFDGTHGRVARLICDVYNADRTPFEGCPRLILKRTLAIFAQRGLSPVCGPELEFFLFLRDEAGHPTVRTHDAGGYFDLLPVDRGEEARRAIVNALEAMGFEIEAAHHEVAPGQHEIDFRFAGALETADRVTTFRMVVKKIALDFGLHATFMPKPLCGVNGSGMHTHQSVFQSGAAEPTNAFYDPSGPYQLSEMALHYMGGLLRHARAFVAITNPLVNSYKRLLPGYEAPVNVAWSEHNRSPLLRVPARRGLGTRVEVRVPDPSCNPYLAFAVMLRAGLDGMQRGLDPGPPVNQNIFEMSEREKKRLHITQLPADLAEALTCMQADPLLLETLGAHVHDAYLQAKRDVWQQYVGQVHAWELERYLASY